MSGAALFALGFSENHLEPTIVHLSPADLLGTRLSAYIYIDSAGKITIYNNRPEMGQGTFESIPMIIAEELEVNIEKITILQSPADRKLFGDQMVVGSRSISSNFDSLRKLGASARETLVAAGAKKWNVPSADCYAQDAFVIHRNSGRKLSYADLVQEAAGLQPVQNPKLKDPSKYTIIGTSPFRQDVPSKTNGSAQFGMDCTVKGMLYASVERSPVFLGRIIGFDDSKAKAVKGVRYVLKTKRHVWGHEREGVAVIADTYWAAVQGRNALEVKWDNGELETWSTSKIKEDYKNASQQPGVVFEKKGDFETAFAKAALKLEASYDTPYQTHIPMEPMNAIVFAKKDGCEYWGSTQNPNGVRSQLARQCALDEEKVVIHYTQMGGGFGRRSLTDVAEEAADLSIQTGAPILVIWSREDDLTQGPFRACSLNNCRAGLDDQGRVVALEHKVICQDINNQTGDDNRASRGIAGGINTQYEISNFTINGVLRKMYIPISYWRSVYHSTNCFAHESFMDELAHAAKKDPLEFRLAMLTSHKRYTAVLQTVADKSGWFKPKEEGTGRGIAIVERSGSFVAVVVQVARIKGKVKPLKVTVAIDCGLVVNPDTVIAQTEGCVVMGLTAAYKSGLTIENGKVVQQNFHNYQMLRIDECPQIDVVVVSNNYPPEGAGEAGLPPVAPALTNAIYDMTGKRIRELPLNLNLL